MDGYLCSIIFHFFQMEAGMIGKILACLMIALLAAGSGLAQEKTENSTEKHFKEAWVLKKTSFKQEPEKKQQILLKTVEIYKAIVANFPEDKDACAEACFRIGEILRTLKKTEEAQAKFIEVLAYTAKGDFAARALKEIGHIYRRNKDFDMAIAYYRRIMDECPDQRESCADALTWIGKVYLKQKKY
ncbi:MAG: tetratricopeptide repeat protein, partial [Planctomycetota bacterium]